MLLWSLNRKEEQQAVTKWRRHRKRCRDAMLPSHARERNIRSTGSVWQLLLCLYNKHPLSLMPYMFPVTKEPTNTVRMVHVWVTASYTLFSLDFVFLGWPTWARFISRIFNESVKQNQKNYKTSVHCFLWKSCHPFHYCINFRNGSHYLSFQWLVIGNPTISKNICDE